MFCPNCGAQIPDGTKFCTSCGASLEATQQPQQQPQYQQPQQQYQQQPQYQQSSQQQYQQQSQYQQPQQQYQQQYQQPQYQQYQQSQYQQQYYQANSQPSVGFGEAIKLFFVNYTNFMGRATRSEYWWAMLFVFLVQLTVSLIFWWTIFLPVLVSLGLLIPELSICVRRLHDIGKPWPWILMGLIPLAGEIILIVYFCQPSVPGNIWGPDPHSLRQRA